MVLVVDEGAQPAQLLRRPLQGELDVLHTDHLLLRVRPAASSSNSGLVYLGSVEFGCDPPDDLYLSVSVGRSSARVRKGTPWIDPSVGSVHRHGEALLEGEGPQSAGRRNRSTDADGPWQAGLAGDQAENDRSQAEPDVD